jgi:hypothetical protein
VVRAHHGAQCGPAAAAPAGGRGVSDLLPGRHRQLRAAVVRLRRAKEWGGEGLYYDVYVGVIGCVVLYYIRGLV